MLRHSNDSEPGYTRKRQGDHWQYFDETGARVTDRDEIDRLNRLALPPAYTHAWFCKDPNAPIPATGQDAPGLGQGQVCRAPLRGGGGISGVRRDFRNSRRPVRSAP